MAKARRPWITGTCLHSILFPSTKTHGSSWQKQPASSDAAHLSEPVESSTEGKFLLRRFALRVLLLPCLEWALLTSGSSNMIRKDEICHFCFTLCTIIKFSPSRSKAFKHKYCLAVAGSHCRKSQLQLSSSCFRNGVSASHFSGSTRLYG